MFKTGNEALKTEHIEAWRRVAQLFNSQAKLIYLPLSEGAGTKVEVQNHLVNIAAAIHAADSTPVASQPPIMLQPAYGNARFARQIDFTKFDNGRYFISTNFYPVFDYQHQGTASAKNSKQIIDYPGGKITTIKSTAKYSARRAQISARKTRREILHSIVGLRSAASSLCNYLKKLRKSYPAGSALEVSGGIIGEYAVPNYAPGAPRFITDSNRVFNSCGLWSANHARYGDPKWDATLFCNRFNNTCIKDPANARYKALQKFFNMNSF